MPERFVAEISGHSTRVGATQDLAALDIDLAANHTGGRVEFDADAAAICGADQCGKVGYPRAAEQSGWDSLGTTGFRQDVLR